MRQELSFDDVLDVVREMSDDEFETLAAMRALLNAGIITAIPMTADGELIH